MICTLSDKHSAGLELKTAPDSIPESKMFGCPAPTWTGFRKEIDLFCINRSYPEQSSTTVTNYYPQCTIYKPGTVFVIVQD